MNSPAIQVSELGKRYVIEHEANHDNLRDTLHHTARKAWRKLRWGTTFETEEFWALKGVSFEVQPGAVVGIIGRNGAGKSTLLKILSRITEPSAGRVVLRGRVASLLEVGTGFHPELSGRENIFLNGAILGMSRAEIRRKFDEIVAFSEVERFLDTPVKRYSSGMYVRLAFAVAAHLEPEILIVDEVLAVGDAAFQKKCLGKIREVAEGGGRTVLFVSHTMAAVRSLCHRCVWLDAGRVRADGNAQAVTDAYLQCDRSADAADIDLAAPSGTPHGPLFLRRLRLNGGREIRHGEPLRLELVAQILSPQREISFGAGFSNLDGTRILTLESDLPGPRLDCDRTGFCTLQASVDTLHLQPGLYRIDLGIRSGDIHSVQYLPSAALIEVLPGPRTPASLLREGGHVRYPSAWACEFSDAHPQD